MEQESQDGGQSTPQRGHVHLCCGFIKGQYINRPNYNANNKFTQANTGHTSCNTHVFINTQTATHYSLIITTSIYREAAVWLCASLGLNAQEHTQYPLIALQSNALAPFSTLTVPVAQSSIHTPHGGTLLHSFHPRSVIMHRLTHTDTCTLTPEVRDLAEGSSVSLLFLNTSHLIPRDLCSGNPSCLTTTPFVSLRFYALIFIEALLYCPYVWIFPFALLILSKSKLLHLLHDPTSRIG